MTQSFLPGPWVNPEIREERPWSHSGGIVKFFEFPVRIDAMSRRAFHLYWQRHHSPNVMNVTGFSQFMRKYNSGHIFLEPCPELPAHYSQDHVFEGAAEVWVNSWQEVGDWLGHPLYAEIVQPDEPRFIAQDGRSAILVTKEEKLYEPDPDMAENGKVKAYLLMGRRPGLDRDVFHQRLSEYGHAILAEHGLHARLLKLVISHRLPDPNPIEGLPETDVDGVVELWFASRADMAAFFADTAYIQGVAPLEADFADLHTLRALAARMRVVHDEFSFQPSTMQPLPFNWADGEVG